MQSLSLKIPLSLIALFFLSLASRDLNIHHTMLSLDQKADTVKVASLTSAELAATKRPLRIKQAD
ncbi:hypothetical protein [Methylophilus sp. YYY-1]|uniref:hypothetical protein n=1 Tax=Methylophilus sp. YYY-1 TaxID=2682087 RepID=UPI0023B280BD|nr:hypothetical protein [Methylophilus sp. YYY-1]MDF0377988.1 hypothetical protein [Methylophilus sp. YYY-1]